MNKAILFPLYRPPLLCRAIASFLRRDVGAEGERILTGPGRESGQGEGKGRKRAPNVTTSPATRVGDRV